MTNQALEIIEGERIFRILRDVIETRQLCRIRIHSSQFGGLTLILNLRKISKVPCLVIDKIPHIDPILSQPQYKEIDIDFLEKGGVTCYFRTRIIESQQNFILAEIPKTIFRLQRRRFFRIDAKAGAEIIFYTQAGGEERAKVKDYGVGGIAFFLESQINLKEGEILYDINLKLPCAGQWVTFHIPKGIVKRIKKELSDKFICAVEFLEILEKTREKLWYHILEDQRSQIRKFKGLR